MAVANALAYYDITAITASGAIFPTLLFLHNLRMGQLR
jgi:hypothetical protein